MTRKPIAAAILSLSALLAMHPRICEAAGTHEAILKARRDAARICLKSAKDLAGRKCYFALAQQVKLGLHFCPDDRELGSMAKVYAFVPALPEAAGPYSADGLPKTGDLWKRKPELEADAVVLNEFFTTGLDSILLAYATDIKKLASDPKTAPLAARELLSQFQSAEKNGWRSNGSRPGFGVPRFEEYVAKALLDMGWEQRPPWPEAEPRWYSPQEIEGESELDLDYAKERLETAKARVKPKKAQALDAEVAVEQVLKPSAFEDVLELSFNKLRSSHFQVEGEMEERDLRRILTVQEAGFRRLVQLLKLEEPYRFEKPARTVLLPGRSYYEKYVTEMTAMTEKEKEWTIKNTGATPDRNHGCWVRTSRAMSDLLLDQCIACTLWMVLERFGFHRTPHWLDFGLEARLTLDVLGTADTSYVSMKHTTGKGEYLLGFNYYWWELDVRRLERTRRAPSTDAVLAFTNINEMIPIQRAKMFCLVDFFLRTDPERMKKMMRAMTGEGWRRDKEGDFSALKAAGWTVKQMDEAFRKWILEGK